MKRKIIAIIAASASTALMAQVSAVDALQITQPDFKGTARFMAMGGAFTALGGDLSTIVQNPAGIGVYRKSEIGGTLALDFQKSKTQGYGAENSESQTKFFCNNFGYVGTSPLKGALESISWGASYNRLSSFDRVTYGYAMPTQNSVTNYIAAISNGYNPDKLDFGNDYNPYYNPDNDWLSVLGYTSYMINSQSPANPTSYYGLFQQGTVGDAEIKVRERGFVDEYSFDFGGNVSDIFYWGVGVGITDLSYTREVNYSESMQDARIYDKQSGNLVNGNAGIWLDNYKRVQGSGWNLKVGAIFKPVNELRIGVAFHTPTWYSLSETYQAGSQFSYYNPARPESTDKDKANPLAGSESTDVADFDWKFNSPWKVMIGVAAVVDNKAIISADYEYQAYPAMRVKTPTGAFSNDFSENTYTTADIKNMTQGASIIRLGAEFRVTPQFSLRAGYNYMTSGVKTKYSDGGAETITAGTDPSFSLNKSIQHISLGAGYKYQAWSFDLAFVYRMRDSNLYCYTNYDFTPNEDHRAPSFKTTDNNISAVLSISYKF